MTKKDYELIAKAVNECAHQLENYEQWKGDGGGADFLWHLTVYLCNELGALNSKFNKLKFHDACYKGLD